VEIYGLVARCRDSICLFLKVSWLGSVPSLAGSLLSQIVMQLPQKVRNKVRALLQAYGTRNVKMYLWDAEFSQGRWDCLDTTPGDCVYSYIEKAANGGSILDLGCGSGSTANELSANTYRDYTGVDISDVAIDRARKRTEENGRADKSRFFQADVSSYVPAQQFDVILFRDSIYYVARPNIRPMLERYSKYLKQSGVFIVRMDGRDKRGNIVDIIEGNFDILEKHMHEKPDAVVLVFR
jgi:SAM-dependent methyltransferase